MSINQNNISEPSDKNNTNLKQQFYALKQKVDNLEKNNLEMIEIYKAEEERLNKSNEFLSNKKNNNNNSKTIQDLESEVLRMRNAIQQLKKLIAQKNNQNPDLIENENKTNNEQNNDILNNPIEQQAKEEYLKNYKNKLMTEFENKLLMKHKELVNYYIERNKQIKRDNGSEEDYVNIDEIINFSIKEKKEEISKNPKNKEKNDLDDLIKKIKDNINIETKEIEVDKINKILSLLCLKEEYPKDFFINYILDEAFTTNENETNNDDSFTKLLELEKEAMKEPENEIQKFIQKKPKRKSAFHSTVGISGVSINKICIKLCKLFDIKKEDDIGRIKKYLNKIKILDNNLRHYFEKNLSKYRFAPYEQHEKEEYDEKIKDLFEKDILKIQNVLNFDDNIIRMEIFEEFIKKYFNSNASEDFIYYMMSLMKLTKKEKNEEKNKKIKSLGFFEFYLIPLFKKVNN